jgi:hypothetical protein
VTTSQIIACTISWTAAIVAITALVRVWRVRRQPVRWETDGCMVTFDRRISEAEVEAFKARWLATYGNNQGAHPVEEVRPVDDEQACGCWNGVRCVKHCTCRQCTALRRAAANSEEESGA